MKFKSCLTCEHFQKNLVVENVNKETYNTKVLEYYSAWCWHSLSDGNKTSHDMIYHGACGRDMKLWKRKGYNVLEIGETD